MLLGEKMLYKIANNYGYRVEKGSGNVYFIFKDRNLEIFATFREALASMYDIMVEDTIRNRNMWRKEIAYIENHCNVLEEV